MEQISVTVNKFPEHNEEIYEAWKSCWQELEGSEHAASDMKYIWSYQINDGEIRAGGIRTGKLIADYILEYKNIKLAVIEAKSDELEVGEGVAQAKLYAQKLRIKNSYATNGKEIYEINHESKTEGIVSSFPSPDELWERTFKETNEWTDRFNAIPFEDNNGTMQARYYQELAVNRVVHAIANKKEPYINSARESIKIHDKANSRRIKVI